MSTVSVTNIKNAASGSNNLVLDTSGNTTAAGTVAMGSSYLRNRIINGDMRIDQRNAGAAITPTANSYTVDRWVCGLAQASKLSFQQSTTAPTNYINSLLCTSTSAYTVGASEAFVIRQFIEGLNISDLAWGTASAVTVTLSFWVRSSLTGTFGGSIKNSDATRSYPFSYSISAANTWEQKSVIIAGDTTGTWLTTNGIGMGVAFSLGAGASASNNAGAWAAGNYSSATGATSVVGTNGATFYITGVQLEVGTVATPFERRLYGTELALCQRYYQKSYDIGTVPGSSVTGSFNGLVWSNGVCDAATAQIIPFTITFPVPMRAAPSFFYWDAAGNSSKFSTFTGGGFSRTDNQGGFGSTYGNSNMMFAGYGTPGAGNSYAFTYAAISEL